MGLRKGARQSLLALMRAQGRSIDEMAMDLCRREGSEPLVGFRHVYGWSQEEATEAYNARLGLHVGESGHMTRQRLGNWRTGPSAVSHLH